MSKKIIAVVLILILIVSGFAFVNFVYLKNSNPQQILPDQKAIPSSTQNVSLALIPSPLITTAGKEAVLNLTLDGNLYDSGNKLIQIELAYDPNMLYGLYITPGEYLINPQIILNNIDILTGRISYALSGVTNVSDSRSNIVARINFTTSNYGLMREAEIKFLPKTLIKTDDKTVKISSTNNAKIVIKPGIFQYIPEASIPAQLKPRI
jgi:hypothetical protein